MEMTYRLGAGDEVVEERKPVTVCIKQSAFYRCLSTGSFGESGMTDQIDELIVGWRPALKRRGEEGSKNVKKSRSYFSIEGGILTPQPRAMPERAQTRT